MWFWYLNRHYSVVACMLINSTFLVRLHVWVCVFMCVCVYTACVVYTWSCHFCQFVFFLASKEWWVLWPPIYIWFLWHICLFCNFSVYCVLFLRFGYFVFVFVSIFTPNWCIIDTVLISSKLLGYWFVYVYFLLLLSLFDFKLSLTLKIDKHTKTKIHKKMIHKMIWIR